MQLLIRSYSSASGDSGQPRFVLPYSYTGLELTDAPTGLLYVYGQMVRYAICHLSTRYVGI